MEEAPIHLIRASVQGIVFLVESATGRVFTYNPDRPVFVGTLEKIPESDKNSISKTNGCLATARVRYRPDIREIMAAERSHVGSPVEQPQMERQPQPVALHKMQTQLVNTDFSIGAKIRREILHKILSERYHLTVSYEPSIYQGVKTKYFYNAQRPAGCPPGLCPCEKLCKGTGDGTQLGSCKKITISPFQTGQIIITGARTMDQINEAYEFMKTLFARHAEDILRKNYICPVDTTASVATGAATKKAASGWIQHPSPRNIFKVRPSLLVGV